MRTPIQRQDTKEIERNGRNRQIVILNQIRKYLDWRNWNLGKTQPPADLPSPNPPLTTEIETISGSLNIEIGTEVKKQDFKVPVEENSPCLLDPRTSRGTH